MTRYASEQEVFMIVLEMNDPCAYAIELAKNNYAYSCMTLEYFEKIIDHILRGGTVWHSNRSPYIHINKDLK